MSIILGGKKIEIPGVETISFLDDPKKAPYITDKNPRTRTLRSVVLHTHKGTAKGTVKEGTGASSQAEILALYQTRTERSVSWDATIDIDGTVLWQNDPLVHYSWHATSWNPYSLGIEMVQYNDGALDQRSIDALVWLLDRITAETGIQRQIAVDKDGAPWLKMLSRADEKSAMKGSDMVGIFAHCQNTKSRGKGDPGEAAFKQLLAHGYEGFNFEENEDLTTWAERQRVMGITPDGVPLLRTQRALKAGGKPDGMWVSV